VHNQKWYNLQEDNFINHKIRPAVNHKLENKVSSCKCIYLKRGEIERTILTIKPII
jgi:hypothetical protein